MYSSTSCHAYQYKWQYFRLWKQKNYCHLLNINVTFDGNADIGWPLFVNIGKVHVYLYVMKLPLIFV